MQHLGSFFRTGQTDPCRNWDGPLDSNIASNPPFYFIVLLLGSMQVQLIWSNLNEFGISSLSLNLGHRPDSVPKPFHFHSLVFYCMLILNLICVFFIVFLFICYLLMRSFIKFTGNSKKKESLTQTRFCCLISRPGMNWLIVVIVYLHPCLDLYCLIFK